jgi:hypothetical protein
MLPLVAALIRLGLGPLGGSVLLSNPNRALVGCLVRKDSAETLVR